MRLIKVDSRDKTFLHKKSWGYEVWIENDPQYCGKLLHIEPLQHTSMHFHRNKTETMYVQSGTLYLDLVDPDDGHQYTHVLKPGDKIQIFRCHLHSLRSLDYPVEIFEFSTHHEDLDSYRAWR